MQDDLDWRVPLGRLAAGWRTIAMAGAVAALVAAVFALVAGVGRYRAAAVLVVARPDAALAFDPRFSELAVDAGFPYRVASPRTYAELARSDAVAAAARERLGGASAPSARDLRRRVRIEAAAEGTLITVEARGASPEDAARLANAWAEAFSAQMEAVLGPGTEATVAVARQEAEDAVQAADAALGAFHSESPLPARQIELSRSQARLASLLEADGRLADVARDAEALRAGLGPADAADGAGRLAGLVARLAAVTSAAGLSVTLQVPDDAVTSGPATDPDRLLAGVSAGREALAAEREALPERLTALRAEVEAERTRLGNLDLRRTLAQERLQAVSRRAGELAVLAATARPELRVASAAVPPSGPDLTDVLRPSAAALALGLVWGAALVLALPWLRERLGRPPS